MIIFVGNKDYCAGQKNIFIIVALAVQTCYNKGTKKTNKLQAKHMKLICCLNLCGRYD